ncbi:ABC transporter ATP-binding protein [Pseudahrensia aquimaris]|uniref:ABC transporter ATP-binding protein n=1 Tax=Pseudahrensia aquimaris TaxID=744461 RepID=A0ABW3FF70_9HYPH
MLLTVRNLEKTFATADGDIAVLRGIDLDLANGETLALTGESGSGKSTLLHLIAGLDAATAGDIFFQGQSLQDMDDARRAELRRVSVGIVFQQFNLIPSLNTRENLRFYARLAGREDAAWSNELADRLGLTHHLDHYPEQLSGGQQQRVALGRTLAAKPQLVLADEPTGNLDEDTADQIISLLAELVAETQTGLLMVTHSTRLASRLDRRLHLKAGRIQ